MESLSFIQKEGCHQTGNKTIANSNIYDMKDNRKLDGFISGFIRKMSSSCGA